MLLGKRQLLCSSLESVTYPSIISDLMAKTRRFFRTPQTSGAPCFTHR